MNSKNEFLQGMKQASRPTGPLLATIFTVFGLVITSFPPLLFGVNGENSSTFYGQFIMTFMFVFWIALILAWVKFKEGRSISSLGFATGFKSQSLLGLALGLGLTSLVVVTNLLLGQASLGQPNWTVLLPSLLLLLGFSMQASAEEIGYRGYLMQAYGAKWQVGAVVAAQAIIFTLGHIGNGLNPLAIVTMLAVSYCLAMWILATGSLWGAMSFHIFWNWSQANFWGAPVSNIKMETSVFTFTTAPGSELISGGSFGLEGSLLTIALLLGIGVYFHRQWAQQ